MAPDEYIYEVSASAKKLQEINATIDKNIATQEAIGVEGNETLLRIRAIRGQLTEQAVTPLGGGELGGATRSLEEQNALRRAGRQIDLETLDIIKAQTQQRIEQAAVVARLQGEQRSGLILPTGRAGSAGELAGAQVAAEERARIRQRLLAPATARTPGALILPGGGPAAGSFEQLGGQGALRELAREEEAFQAQLARSRDLIAGELALERELGGAQEQVNRMAAAEGAGRREARTIQVEQLATDRARLVANQALQAEMARIRASPAQAMVQGQAANVAYQTGLRSASESGKRVAPAAVAALAAAPPDARLWEAADREMVRTNVALGEYEGFAKNASITSSALTANLTRLGLAEAEASNAMRRHGALTTEYLSALARGETSIAELGYQVSATIGKFAGWTVAAAAVGTAMGAVYEFGKGAIDAASGVQQLTRTIDDLDRVKASTALQNLSADVNVPIKEAADAVFQFSRTFHTLDEAVTAARLALATYKLDGVSLADSVKAQTAIHQQFGLSAKQLIPIYDELAQGQQKFNARVTEQVPALLKSAAAVKIAGGDLRSLIELTTIALRTTSLSGSQVGTAFSRSAANFLNPTTTKGKADRAVLKSLGLDTSLGYTDLIFQAINKAPSMKPNDIARMTQAIFGPLRGGLMAGLFTGGPALVGPVGRELSPSGAKNVLGTELQKELHTITQEVHAFVNALQRVGAALAQTGTLTPFGLALHVIVGALDGLRAVIDLFDQLPHAAKEVASGLVEARIAMLLLSRTSIGGSIADRTGLSRIGLGPSSETRMRQTLGKGTFNALKATEDEYARTQSQLLTTGAKEAELAKRKTMVEAEIAREGAGTRQQYEEANAISAQIVALQRQAYELELQSKAQLAVTRDLEAQYVGVSKRRGPKSFGSAKLEELNTASGAAASEGLAASESASAAGAGRAAAAAKAAGSATAEAAAAIAGLSTATIAEQVALQEKAAEDARLAVAAGETTAAAAAETAGAELVVVETGALSVALNTAGAATLGMARGIGGLLMAMDPLLLAMLGLPIVFELLSGANHGMDDAIKKAAATAAKPVATLKDLAAHAKALHDAEQHATDEIHKLEHEKSPLSDARSTIRDALSDAFGLSVKHADHPAVRGNAAEWRRTLGGLENPLASMTSGKQPTPGDTAAGYVKFYDNLDAQAKADAKSASGTKAGRERYYAQLAALKTLAAQYAAAHPDKDSKQYLAAINTALQQDYNAFQSRFALGKSIPDLFSQFERMSTADIRKRVSGLGDLFSAGIGGADSLKQASAGVAYLGNKINKGSSSADLQAFGSAMQSFQSDLHKLVGDFVHAAATTPSGTEQASDLAKARAAGQQEIKNIHAELELSIKKLKGNKSAIAKAIALANYRLGLVADEMNTVQQADDARIQAATALAASRITTIGPEGDIARAQVVLNGLYQEYAQAKADNAGWATLSGLLNQIDNSKLALAEQKIANGQALIDANNAVKSASIGGTGPGAEAARAQQEVSNAEQDYNYVKRTQPDDPAAIANAYARLLTARNSLNSTLVSNAQSASQDAAALVQAQGSLAEAQTTDPVKQAEIELRTAIQVLGTIKPSNYNTYSEYQAAYIQQQATVAKDKQGVEQQIVDTRMQDLQFQLHTQRITDQQYISGLQQLLKMAKLTKQQRQQIQTEIFDAMHQSELSLGTDSIRLPTEYEVRRGLRAGMAARDRRWTDLINATPSGGDNITNNRVNMNIVVHSNADLAKFAAVLDNALRSNFTGSAQAMGLI